MHSVPKELKGEERIFSINSIGLHFNKKAIYYNGPATLLVVLLSSIIDNMFIIGTLFIFLNVLAYPLGHMKLPRKKFEGGNVPLDIYIYRKILYTYKNQNIYLRYMKK